MASAKTGREAATAAKKENEAAVAAKKVEKQLKKELGIKN